MPNYLGNKSGPRILRDLQDYFRLTRNIEARVVMAEALLYLQRDMGHYKSGFEDFVDWEAIMGKKRFLVAKVEDTEIPDLSPRALAEWYAEQKKGKADE